MAGPIEFICLMSMFLTGAVGMSVIVVQRILRKRLFKRVVRNRAFYVVLFFVVSWITNALLFYYSEYVVAGRTDIDIWTSLYWSIITMATIGYGDVTPVRGLGWIVAGFAAIMGILAYTLTVSVIADWFLSVSIRRSLGMAPLKKKKILVIGGSPTCNEIIDELILNGLEEEIGWLTPEKPRSPPRVDYLIGDPIDENSLLKAGVQDADYIILCMEDDSKALHVALLAKKYNPNATYAALVSKHVMEEILKQAGVQHVLSHRVLGRALASAVFEPEVLRILADIVSVKGKGDLIQKNITPREAGLTIIEYEEKLNQEDKQHRYRVVALIRNNEYTISPEPTTKLQENDTLILIRGIKQ